MHLIQPQALDVDVPFSESVGGVSAFKQNYLIYLGKCTQNSFAGGKKATKNPLTDIVLACAVLSRATLQPLKLDTARPVHSSGPDQTPFRSLWPEGIPFDLHLVAVSVVRTYW